MANEGGIILGRGVKQRITDAYRMYKKGTLHMNYANNTVDITVGKKPQGALIFGEAGEVICSLANGAAQCSFRSIFDKIKEL